ncbi:MAG: AsmA family protein, partial [Bacteroidetes bacterium]|nr:AsmA family protein [Bacteroidota bacterium]
MIFKKNKVKRSLPRKIGNGIIWFFVSIFILLVLFFAFSQTSTFRNMLRSKIIEIANNSLNGKINIRELEGTLITHLIFRDVTIENNLDTLLNAKKIEIALNPFYILAKRIKVTRLNISDAKIALLETEREYWNYTNLIRSDSISTDIPKVTLQDDSTKNGFPLLIDFSDFSLQNISFKFKRNQYLTTHAKYESINFDDMEFENLNLKLDLLADFKKNEFLVDISQLSFSPNLTNFKLQNISGIITLSENFAEIKNLEILTDKSTLNLSARLDDLNVFGEVNLENFKNYPINFKLVGEPFNMSDLSSFIESTNFMKGEPIINIEGKGIFSDFNFLATLKLDKTNINLEGNLTKLNTPSELFIKAKFNDSQVSYNEIDTFLSDLELPKYPKLLVKKINLNFEGEPLKFKLKGGANMGKGNFGFDAFMDITKEQIEYDYNVKTRNLDLTTTLGIDTKLNSEGHLKGNGFDPEQSNSSLWFKIENSFVEGYHIDTLSVNLQTIDKLIDLKIYSQLDSMKNEISGKLNLVDSEKPTYNLQGTFDNLNLFNYTKDSTLNSSLNFKFDINGHSLDLDKTEGNFKLGFHNSRIGSNQLDSLNFNINLSKIDSTRLISFKSSILDFNIKGNFLIDETFNLLAYQASKIGYAITQKLNEINPVHFSADSSQTLDILMSNKSISQKNIYLDYDFNFKDFKLIAALLNRDKIEISGQGYGYLENDSDNFTISTNINLDWLFLYKGSEVFYISGIESNLDIGANNNNYLFDNIFGSISFNSEEMVSSLNINNIKADLIF